MSTTFSSPDDLNIREQLARIDRALAENRKFQAETDKLFEEARKLAADARKAGQDTRLAIWQVAFAGFASGAVLIGAIIGAMVTILRTLHMGGP